MLTLLLIRKHIIKVVVIDAKNKLPKKSETKRENKINRKWKIVAMALSAAIRFIIFYYYNFTLILRSRMHEICADFNLKIDKWVKLRRISLLLYSFFFGNNH